MSFGHLIRELRDDMTALIRQEIALGQTEMSEKLSRYSKNLIFLASGALVAFLGVVFLVTALSQGVELWLIDAGIAVLTATWLAPLIVGGVIAIIGAILAIKGARTISHESPTPEKTMHTIKEDVQWARKRRH